MTTLPLTGPHVTFAKCKTVCAQHASHIWIQDHVQFQNGTSEGLQSSVQLANYGNGQSRIRKFTWNWTEAFTCGHSLAGACQGAVKGPWPESVPAVESACAPVSLLMLIADPESRSNDRVMVWVSNCLSGQARVPGSNSTEPSLEAVTGKTRTWNSVWVQNDVCDQIRDRSSLW